MATKKFIDLDSITSIDGTEILPITDNGNVDKKISLNQIYNSVNSVTGKNLSDNNLTNALKTSYDDCVANKHNHSNKTLLDTLVSNGTGALLLADDGTYKEVSGGVNKFNNLGTISANFALSANQITTGAVSGNYTFTLPTVTDTTKQVVCIFDFTTSNTAYPSLTGLTNLKWVDTNGGKVPSAYSILTGVRNILIFKSIWVSGTLYWETEYRTCGAVETTFTRPNLSANGSLGGSSFAVSGSSVSCGDFFTAVNGNVDAAYWQANTTVSYYIIYNPYPIKVSYFTWINYSGGSFAPTYGSVYGSNDNSNYVLLCTYSNSVTSGYGSWAINIPSSAQGFYKYYKITIDTSSNGSSPVCTELFINATYINV